MKKRMLAMLLCLCMVMSLFVGSVTAAGDRVPTAYDGNIEKKATFNPDYIGFGFPISANPETEKSWAAATQYAGVADLVMVITDAMVVRDEYWYAVEAAEGYELPAELQEKPWIFQNVEGAGVGGDSLIIQEEPVPEETVPETSAPEEDVPEGDAPGAEAPGEDVPEESTPEETEPEQPEEETPQAGWKSYADFIADQNEKILEDPSVYVGFEAEFNVDRWVSFQYAADPATAVPGSEENILDAADVTDSQGNSIRVVISGYAEDADGYVWYQVEAAEGYTLPDVLAENPYILNLAFPEDPAALNILPLTGMFQGESVEIKKSPEMAGKSETVPTAELPDFFDVTPVKDANGNAYYDLGDTTGWHENLAENGYHYVDASCVILIAPEVTVAYEKLKKADSAKEFDEIWESLPESVREQFTEKHLAVLDRCQEELNNVKYSDTVTYNGKELEVSVTGPIPKTGVELSVSPVSDADILNGGFDVKSATEIITALDIKILQENGTEWQPEDGKRIYVSIDMAALGIEDESIVRLHHKHGEEIYTFEVFIVLDGKVTVGVNGLSTFAVTAAGSTQRAQNATTYNPDQTINMTVGEERIFYVNATYPEVDRRGNPTGKMLEIDINRLGDWVGTWQVSDTSGAIFYEVFSNQTPNYNKGMYVPWIRVVALKEASNVTITFRYNQITYNNYNQPDTVGTERTEVHPINITAPKATDGRALYLLDTVNYDGRITAVLVNNNGEVIEGLEGAAFNWTRSDGLFIAATAYENSYRSINIAKDHAGLTEARKDTDTNKYNPVTYTLVATLADGTQETATYTVHYQSEILNSSFEAPELTAGNYTYYPNGWADLVWKTTTAGTSGNLIRDIEFGEMNNAGTTDFGVPRASGGDQFAELNAEEFSALYQDIISVPEEEIEWDFTHAPRRQQSWNNQYVIANKMFVVIGPTEEAQKITTQQQLLDLGTAAKDAAAAKGTEFNTRFLAGLESVTVKYNNTEYSVWYHDAGAPPENNTSYYTEDKNYGWTEIAGTYVVPKSQYRTRLFFVTDPPRRNNGSVEENTKNFGNLIDSAKAGQYKSYLIEYFVETFDDGIQKLQYVGTGERVRDPVTNQWVDTYNNKDMDESGDALIYSSVKIQYLDNYFVKLKNYYLHRILINGENAPYNIRYAGDASLYIEKYNGTPTKPTAENGTVVETPNQYKDYDIVMQVFFRDTVVAVKKELIFPTHLEDPNDPDSAYVQSLTEEQKLKIMEDLNDPQKDVNGKGVGYEAVFALQNGSQQQVDGSYAQITSNTALVTQRDPAGNYTGYISLGHDLKSGTFLVEETATSEIPGLILDQVTFKTSRYQYGKEYAVGSINYDTIKVSKGEPLRSSQFILDNDYKIAELVVQNIYREKETTIYYKAVGNGKVQLTTGGEALDTPKETLKFYSGKAVGAVAIPGIGASFIGWFTDPECTIPVEDFQGVYDENAKTFKPNANIIDKTEVTFYAKFETCSITINRENAPNQSFVYHVTNGETGADKIEFFVTLDCGADGKASKTILEVPDGTYTIKEVKDWSWRYDDGSKFVTIQSANEEKRHLTATFNGGLQTDDWLSGLAEKIKKNIFKGVATQ